MSMDGKKTLTDIEKPEDLIFIDLLGIPNLAIVYYQAATTFVVFLFHNIQHARFDERLLLVLKLQSKDGRSVISTKFSDATKLCVCESVFVFYQLYVQMV